MSEFAHFCGSMRKGFRICRLEQLTGGLFCLQNGTRLHSAFGQKTGNGPVPLFWMVVIDEASPGALPDM